MMHDIQERLTQVLLEKNDFLSYGQAKTWIEVLWDDFQITYARAGHGYQGKATSERVVKQWIENYGDQLHHFVTTNPKFANLLNRSGYPHH